VDPRTTGASLRRASRDDSLEERPSEPLTHTDVETGKKRRRLPIQLKKRLPFSLIGLKNYKTFLAAS
jgi:hypothetical protein